MDTITFSFTVSVTILSILYTVSVWVL